MGGRRGQQGQPAEEAESSTDQGCSAIWGECRGRGIAPGTGQRLSTWRSSLSTAPGAEATGPGRRRLGNAFSTPAFPSVSSSLKNNNHICRSLDVSIIAPLAHARLSPMSLLLLASFLHWPLLPPSLSAPLPHTPQLPCRCPLCRRLSLTSMALSPGDRTGWHQI